MKSFPMVILGGGVGAGYAAKEFVSQGGGKGQLAIVRLARYFCNAHQIGGGRRPTKKLIR
jgi:hypothetical protein